MNIKELLFLTFVFLLPIDGIDYLNFYVGFFHVTVLDLLLVLMVYLVFLEGTIKGFEVTFFIQKICLILISSCIVSSISLAYVPSDFISYDIKMSFNMLEFAALIFVASQVIKDEIILLKALRVMCISFFIISAATLLKSIGLDVPGDVRGEAKYYLGPFFIGVTGVSGRGIPFSTLALGAFPFVLKESVFMSRSLRLIFAFTYILASIIAYSRGLWVALGIQVIIFMALFQVFYRSLIKRILISITFVGSVLMILFYWQSIFIPLVEIRRETVESRVVGYLAGLEMATSNLVCFLFGSGEGTFVTATASTPHNFLIEILVSKGVLTLILFCLIFFIIIRELVGLLHRNVEGDIEVGSTFPALMIVMLMGLFALGMFTPLFNSMIFWTLVSLVSAHVSISIEREQSA